MAQLRNLMLSVLLSVAATDAAAQSQGFGINCAIRPLQVVELAAPINGIVSEVLVKPGMRVEAGDIIARFDNDLSQASVDGAVLRASLTGGEDAARAQRDALQERVARLEQGLARRAVSRSELDAAKLELRIAEGRLAQEMETTRIAEMDLQEARILLSKSEVRSPVSGLIGEDIIDAGESSQGRHVAIVYVNDPLRVEAFVPTSALPAFIARDSFEIIVNNDQTATVSVVLDYVAPVADLSSNTQSVYFILKSDEILPGYQCMFPAQMNQ